MSRLAVIGDVHGSRRTLNVVLDHLATETLDGVLLVGDLGTHDLGRLHNVTESKIALYRTSVERVLRRVSELGVPVRYVPGNHDLPELDLPGNLDHGVDTVAGLTIAGIGGAGPDRFGFPYEWSEDDIRRRATPDVDVWLVHTPPRNTPLDRVPRRGRNVGSEAIRELAFRATGFLVCGHIHESPGAIQLGNCLCVNAGGLGRPFGKPQVAFIERGVSGDSAEYRDLSTGLRARWRRL